MKKINYYSGILSLAVICFFSSCSTTKYGAHFQSSNHSSSSYSKTEKMEAPALALEDEKADEAVENAEKRSGAEEVSTDVLPKAATLKKLITEEAMDKKELAQKQQQILAETKERLQNMSRKEKRQLRREIRKLTLAEYTKDLPSFDNKEVQQDVTRNVNIIALIFAIIIPPLGVYIDQGVTGKFWISLLLTVLGITSFLFIPALGLLPAIAYSVLVVLGVL